MLRYRTPETKACRTNEYRQNYDSTPGSGAQHQVLFNPHWINSMNTEFPTQLPLILPLPRVRGGRNYVTVNFAFHINILYC